METLAKNGLMPGGIILEVIWGTFDWIFLIFFTKLWFYPTLKVIDSIF